MSEPDESRAKSCHWANSSAIEISLSVLSNGMSWSIHTFQKGSSWARLSIPSVEMSLSWTMCLQWFSQGRCTSFGLRTCSHSCSGSAQWNLILPSQTFLQTERMDAHLFLGWKSIQIHCQTCALVSHWKKRKLQYVDCTRPVHWSWIDGLTLCLPNISVWHRFPRYWSQVWRSRHFYHETLRKSVL